MNKFSLDDLKFKMNIKEIDSEISKLKAEINENMDVYFIDENKEVYDTMMKDYTGGIHKKYDNLEKTDFKNYNDYKNSFFDKFNKY